MGPTESLGHFESSEASSGKIRGLYKQLLSGCSPEYSFNFDDSKSDHAVGVNMCKWNEECYLPRRVSHVKPLDTLDRLGK